MSTAIYWFTNDLRTHDMECLQTLHQKFDQLICLYCYDTSLHHEVLPGVNRIGAFRNKFLIETLEDLQHTLSKLGNQLVVTTTPPLEAIPKLIQEHNVQQVFVQTNHWHYEANLISDIQQQIRAKLSFAKPNTLFSEDQLPFAIGELPSIFTKFRIAIESKFPIIAPVNTVEKIPPPPKFILVKNELEQLKATALMVSMDDRAAFKWCGGEQKAMQRIVSYFFDSGQVSNYKQTRNRMIGEGYSTKLSPWMANGALSVKQCYHAVREYESLHGSNESTYWVIFELLWREYFFWVSKRYGSSIFLKRGIAGIAKPSNPDVHHFRLWMMGKTGEALIDANMTELRLTGWMSNRGRQNVASYLINDLKLPWRWGATYFEKMLIDYDTASNWCNWMYLAGVGNDPRPDRYFNIEKQTAQYDPDGAFRKLWLS